MRRYFRIREVRRYGGVSRNLVLLLLGGTLVTGILAIMRQSSSHQIGSKSDPEVVDNIGPLLLEGSSGAWVTKGGVTRPATDVLPNQFQAPKPPLLKRDGGYPKVALDANAQVSQVAEALKTGKNPERYSSFVVPRNFDASEFTKDPEGYAQSYASTVEPGRVYAPAQPGLMVPVLRISGNRHSRVIQGESVRLKALAVPYAPVTFSSSGLGQFDNLLTSITVVADKDGIATASFTATPGTKKNVNILGASPLLAEQIKFTLSIELPPAIVAQNTNRSEEKIQ
jgi:hypothetical protein